MKLESVNADSFKRLTNQEMGGLRGGFATQTLWKSKSKTFDTKTEEKVDSERKSGEDTDEDPVIGE